MPAVSGEAEGDEAVTEQTTSKIYLPTDEDLRKAAFHLGYRICDSHSREMTKAQWRTGLITTLSVLLESVADRTPSWPETNRETQHNVAAEVGLIYCDDPLHAITDGCCGVRRNEG